MVWNYATVKGDEGNKHLLGNVINFVRSIQNNTQKEDGDDMLSVQYSSSNMSVVVGVGFNEDRDAGTTSFHHLPIGVQLHILSYLDVASLCRTARVSVLFRQLTDDAVLWETKLRRDSRHWEVIDHVTFPENYRRTCPDLSPKDIYTKCCPEYRNQELGGIHGGNASSQLSRLRNYFGLSIPRIVIFGSGLDSSGLMGRIMSDQRTPFTVAGMFPGHGGLGSGITLNHQQNGTINLIALYALSKAERENAQTDKPSRLLVEEKDSIINGGMSLSQPIKQLCMTINSFIYIVDGSSEDKITNRSEEFKAMITNNDRWLQPGARVLVLCIVPNATVQSVSSLSVARKLDLVNLSRPWQVRQCHVNSLYGLVPGLRWVTGHVGLFS